MNNGLNANVRPKSIEALDDHPIKAADKLSEHSWSLDSDLSESAMLSDIGRVPSLADHADWDAVKASTRLLLAQLHAKSEC